MKRFLLLASSFAFCFSVFTLEEEDLAARVKYHLTIRDIDGAMQEAKEGLKKYPNSQLLQKAYLRVLCQRGNENEALLLCKKLVDLEKGGAENRHLLETLAWGALGKGQHSPQLFVRLNALVGSAFTNDSRAIPAILKELRGSNAILRSVALKLASHMGDEPFRKEILRLLKEEKVWYVRLSVLEAIGQLQMVEAKPLLAKIVESDRTIVEEKGLAILILASLYENCSDEDMQKLIMSKRAGLRQLACQIAVQLDRKELALKLLPLLNDSSPDVRVACLSALALLEVHNAAKTAPLLKDAVPKVAITAAWHHLRHGDKEGGKVLESYLESESAFSRRLAAAAIASCGPKGVEIAKDHMRLSKDIFVRLNLSLGLIALREDVPVSCMTIAEGLRDKGDGLWMWDTTLHPVFRVLTTSRVRHIDQIANYPMIVDSLTQLDLLGLLSMLEYPKALDAVKAFLMKGRAELVGSAAGTLIQEIEEEGIEALKALLQDEESEVRLEAALILAMWGKESSGLDVLIEAYEEAPRERKIQILEAMGRSGDPRAVPFLLEVLGEPFQVLRIVAASALIQCLYR
jgi:HEAT repeat protein